MQTLTLLDLIDMGTDIMLATTWESSHSKSEECANGDTRCHCNDLRSSWWWAHYLSLCQECPGQLAAAPRNLKGHLQPPVPGRSAQCVPCIEKLHWTVLGYAAAIYAKYEWVWVIHDTNIIYQFMGQRGGTAGISIRGIIHMIWTDVVLRIRTLSQCNL